MYSTSIARLVAEAPLPELGPGKAIEKMRPALSELDAAAVCGDRSICDVSMARCCLAGLWLAFDFLEESHRISQEIETQEGSYWHGVMHRREPDYANSKYWFRRVGRHEIFEPLRQRAAELASDASETSASASFLTAQRQWSADRFIDLCETAAHRSGDAEALNMLCRRIARAEWELLFEHCYRRAIGG
jgi:hypothetical protein